MKQVQLAYSAKDCCWRRHYKTSEGKFPVPKGLIARTYHFSNIPKPSFGVRMRTASPQLF